jgi:hypothetical protein
MRTYRRTSILTSIRSFHHRLPNLQCRGTGRRCRRRQEARRVSVDPRVRRLPRWSGDYESLISCAGSYWPLGVDSWAKWVKLYFSQTRWWPGGRGGMRVRLQWIRFALPGMCWDRGVRVVVYLSFRINSSRLLGRLWCEHLCLQHVPFPSNIYHVSRKWVPINLHRLLGCLKLEPTLLYSVTP